MTDAPTHWTATDLRRDRGWSDKLINKYLGQPDLLEQNPHHARGAPMRLFAVERVIAAEKSFEFFQEMDAARARRERAQLVSPRAVQTRRANFAKLCERGPIAIGFLGEMEPDPETVRAQQQELDDLVESLANE